MATRRVQQKPQKKETPIWEGHHCRDCAKVEIVTKFNTLSLKGEPTLGRCPHVTNRSVLLSEDACKNYQTKTICN